MITTSRTLTWRWFPHQERKLTLDMGLEMSLRIFGEIFFKKATLVIILNRRKKKKKGNQLSTNSRRRSCGTTMSWLNNSKRKTRRKVKRWMEARRFLQITCTL